MQRLIHVQIPSATDTPAGRRLAASLQACPICLESRGRATLLLDSRPQIGTRLPRAVSTAHRGSQGVRVAPGWFSDRSAAGVARLQPGDVCILQRNASATYLAEGRSQRRIPHGRVQACASSSPEQECRRGSNPQSGLDQIPMEPTPPAAKSYRVTLDRSGRWHIAFAAIPPEIKAPGREEVVGIDRGVAVTIALSTGELLIAPQLRPAEQRRFEHLARKLSRAQPGSTRRGRIKLAVARLLARQRDRRRDWIEKQTTMLAGRFDVIKLEDLRVGQMTRSARRTREHPGVGVRRKSQLNRRVRDSAWGMIAQRLRDKAAGRVEFVRAAFTSQRCHRCGHTARENRKSQAAFRCVTCGHTDHADVNAAKNIAAGHAVTARGGQPLGRPANREPHRSTSPVSG